MEIISTAFRGLFIIDTIPYKDVRGEFIKPFSKSAFELHGLKCDFLESFYSISKRGVIRGMHFQIPPKEHAKLVYVSSGSIIDVVLDLRRDSATYKRFFHIHLYNRYAIYIPEGFAHGFLSLRDDTIVHYMQTSQYDKKCDCGIRYDSFGFDWEGVAKEHNIDGFIISNRDLSFDSVIEGYF